MIISVSRRTDIPAFYSEWFFNRLKAGEVLVRNPMNARQISKIKLTPDAVDGIVFWTKNPAPMLDRLYLLKDYTYYFQFTLNAYGKEIESGVPSKNRFVIPTFQRLSDLIGPDRIVWRYDPIFLNETYTIDYHIYYFEKLARRLSPYTRKCTISFLDSYRNTERKLASLSIRELTPALQDLLAKNLSEIAHSCGLQMDTCAEEIDLQQYGIQHARCIDDRLLAKLSDRPINAKKDKNQRLACGCVESVDIGAYNTCRYGCLYCYANFSPSAFHANRGRQDPKAPLLIGEVRPEDRITERKIRSCSAKKSKPGV
ncbi:MAG TPA: hypothetical protein DEF06_13265 [Clostridiales bacterium]|uniref:DUF1848 domain-containing protein n=1 Tax=Candidatus Egerieisoma faecipullorum TaxID=2840963 RepID=A0A9D1I892_9CLOT|nr:hypothetical protein [Clostridiales bacterium]HIU28755.1 DUF1848 domain-containing protein [Candidatus Egerieisoma faecipullorum]